jgi:uncharacterized iron-regulated protein
MKQLLILGLLMAGLSILTACDHQNTEKYVQVIKTGEKVHLNDLFLYNVGDTLIVKWSYDYNQWQLDKNWIKFKGVSYQEEGGPEFLKAVVLK